MMDVDPPRHFARDDNFPAAPIEQIPQPQALEDAVAANQIENEQAADIAGLRIEEEVKQGLVEVLANAPHPDGELQVQGAVPPTEPLDFDE